MKNTNKKSIDIKQGIYGLVAIFQGIAITATAERYISFSTTCPLKNKAEGWYWLSHRTSLRQFSCLFGQNEFKIPKGPYQDRSISKIKLTKMKVNFIIN